MHDLISFNCKFFAPCCQRLGGEIDRHALPFACWLFINSCLFIADVQHSFNIRNVHHAYLCWTLA